MARFQCFRTDLHTVRWRLLGGNNRVLGVSASASDDHGAALAEIAEVRTRIHGAELHIEHVHSGQWWWWMNIDGRKLVLSAHGFARRVDAQLSSRRFSARVPQAESDLALVVFQPGRRGREIQLDEDSAKRMTAGSAAMWPQRPVG